MVQVLLLAIMVVLTSGRRCGLRRSQTRLNILSRELSMGFLVTCLNLCRRHMDISPSFHCVGLMMESTEHALFGCTRARRIWQSLISTWSQFDCNHFSNQLWVNEFLSLASNDFALAYMRNRAIYRDKK